MAFVFRIGESETDSDVWIVLLNNGRYFTSVKSGKEGTWSAGGTMADPWGANSNQKNAAWEVPTGIATDGSNNWAVTKPSGHGSATGHQYAYNAGEDPPSGEWTKVSGAFNDVVYDVKNSRFVRFRHAGEPTDRTYIRTSNDGVSYSGETEIAGGDRVLHHAAIHNGTVILVMQDPNSGTTQGDTITVNRSDGTSWPTADHFDATIQSGKNSRISRPVYANNIWVAGNTYGVLKSTDDGSNWTQIDITYDGTACRIQSVGYDTSTSTWLAAGTVGTDYDGDSTGYGIIMKSTDNLSTWSAVKNLTSGDGGFGCIESSNNGIWLAGGPARQVFRSINNGTSWTGPITTIQDDSYTGNGIYDVIAILYEANKNS
ncbi:hypothetical protein OAA09_00985 [bacterium]|nr:hypothetical protein [bacterium]